MAVLLNITRTIPIPHEEGQTLTIKRLAPKQLRMAQEAYTDAALANFRRMGGAGFLAELKAMGDMDRPDAGGKAVAQEDPLNGYDPDTLIREGLIGWSYEQAFVPENVALLDESTAQFAAERILAYAKNRLSETERGNA